jgi:hypothetical protein
MIAYVVKLAPGEKKAVTPLVQRPAVKPAASTRARVPSHPHPPVRRPPAPALPPPTPGPRKPPHA